MKAQKITEPSLTVPGQSVSLQELQKKYMSGSLPDIAHPVNTQDETFANAFDLDMNIFEAMELNFQYEKTMQEYINLQKLKEKDAEELALFERLKAKYATNDTAE